MVRCVTLAEQRPPIADILSPFLFCYVFVGSCSKFPAQGSLQFYHTIHHLHNLYILKPKTPEIQNSGSEHGIIGRITPIIYIETSGIVYRLT